MPQHKKVIKLRIRACWFLLKPVNQGKDRLWNIFLSTNWQFEYLSEATVSLSKISYFYMKVFFNIEVI